MAANLDLYTNKLRDYISNPGSFSGSPGFKFALDQGTQAINRNNSAMRSSGNVLTELMKFGTGLASQDYGGEIDRLGRLSGQEQQFALGSESNANVRRGQDLTDATARRGQDYDFTLGSGNLAGQNWQRMADYDLGRRRFGLDAARTGSEDALNWYRARTDRGRAMSDNYWNGENAGREWWRTLGS